ncbi:actinorhodin polyketide synthase bifunctional cyclase/dehydratase [Pilimelia anulata]|uniref:Actinorhodin polyketide synthase bifunctional cyclase/dehydratase n=1 Tax=Pilimelia anulata TaxID=53371 RepID=A0A8J3BCC0_9ACTN|nr:aromatase/cyclase [Pilimelia anulata]GGJ96543.1 actinorhodin polyketide synthase bifunctional cyclase/dehydratase [Pilimelia anulata]
MTSTRVSHRIDVAAPADAVYRIVGDVRLWPLYFPPTVHAERTGGDDRAEDVRIWAMANGALRTWASRRELDPRRRTVAFAQTEPAAPVAEMSGEWRIEERGPAACRVVLDHRYRAAGDDPAALDLIAAAVDRNSGTELAHLRHAAEHAGTEADVLLDFADSERIAGPAGAVYEFINDAARWPERLPHVVGVDVREDQPGLQYLRMDTRSPDGSVHTTVSGRVCTRPDRIVFKQVELPTGLRAHHGDWTLSPAADGTVTATARHRVILDPAGLAALPRPPADAAAARAAVRRALGANSRATLARARAFAERYRTP